MKTIRTVTAIWIGLVIFLTSSGEISSSTVKSSGLNGNGAWVPLKKLSSHLESPLRPAAAQSISF